MTHRITRVQYYHYCYYRPILHRGQWPTERVHGRPFRNVGSRKMSPIPRPTPGTLLSMIPSDPSTVDRIRRRVDVAYVGETESNVSVPMGGKRPISMRGPRGGQGSATATILVCSTVVCDGVPDSRDCTLQCRHLRWTLPYSNHRARLLTRLTTVLLVGNGPPTGRQRLHRHKPALNSNIGLVSTMRPARSLSEPLSSRRRIPASSP